MRLTISIIFLFFVGAMITTSYGALTVPVGIDGGGVFGKLIAHLPPEAAFAAPVLPALAVMSAFGVLRFVAGVISFAGAFLAVSAIGLIAFNAEFRTLVHDLDLASYRQIAAPAPSVPSSGSDRLTGTEPAADRQRQMTQRLDRDTAGSVGWPAKTGPAAPAAEDETPAVDPIAELLARYN